MSANRDRTDLWAARIEQMTPTERASCGDFNPYFVTPEGRLSLLVESIRRDNRPEGWTKDLRRVGHRFNSTVSVKAATGAR